MSDERVGYDRNKTQAKDKDYSRHFRRPEELATGDFPTYNVSEKERNLFSDGDISSPSSGGSTPDEEVLSPAFVDNLVESFWSRLDQKIDSAISKSQQAPGSPKQDEDFIPPGEKQKWALIEADRYTSIPFLLVFIIEFVRKICGSWKAMAKRRIERWKTSFSESVWRQKLLQIVWHRNMDLLVVLLSLADVLIITFIILQDFEAIQSDIRLSQTATKALLYLCVVILCMFVLEFLAKIITLWKTMFKLKMEVFDALLVAFYFLCEVTASQGFKYIEEPYAKYLHMIAALRLWRLSLVYEEFYGSRNLPDQEEQSDTELP